MGTRSYAWLAAPITAFAVFSLTAGILSAHDPRSKGYFRLFFSDPIHLKAGFATAAVALACFQVFSAAWIFRKLPWQKPAWINPAHRWSGRLAFVCTLPVAYHCIFKLGWQGADSRTLAHSLFGTLFFGAYAAKITIVRLHRFPRPVLPIAGGLLFTLLIGLWYTSALWLYREDASAAPPAAAAATRWRERTAAERSGPTSTTSGRASSRYVARFKMGAAACLRLPGSSATRRSATSQPSSRHASVESDAGSAAHARRGRPVHRGAPAARVHGSPAQRGPGS
ncbi:MAG TPA: DUF6529 family protein [Gaiellaceae bacterium]